VHAGFFDVLHDSHDDHVIAIGDRIDIDLDGIFEESIDQDRLALGDDKGFGDKPIELGVVVADFHGSATEDKAGSDQAGKTDFLYFGSGLLHVSSDAVCRLFEMQFLDELLEFLAVFGILDCLDACTDDRDPGIGQRPG
jgi:hypothetical protein